MKSFIKFLTEVNIKKRDGSLDAPYLLHPDEHKGYLGEFKHDFDNMYSTHDHLSETTPYTSSEDRYTTEAYKTTRGSRLINNFHRFNKEINLNNPDHEVLNKKLDIALHTNVLDRLTSQKTIKPMLLYRGFGEDFDHKSLEKGNIIHDKGYISTSLNPEISSQFSGHLYRPLNNTPVLTVGRIYAPEGTKGHYIDASHSATLSSGEKEFVLPRNTKLKVLAHSYIPKKQVRIVDMAIHHQD